MDYLEIWKDICIYESYKDNALFPILQASGLKKYKTEAYRWIFVISTCRFWYKSSSFVQKIVETMPPILSFRRNGLPLPRLWQFTSVFNF